jgi:hypothetical protein
VNQVLGPSLLGRRATVDPDRKGLLPWSARACLGLRLVSGDRFLYPFGLIGVLQALPAHRTSCADAFGSVIEDRAGIALTAFLVKEDRPRLTSARGFAPPGLAAGPDAERVGDAGCAHTATVEGRARAVEQSGSEPGPMERWRLPSTLKGFSLEGASEAPTVAA